MIVCLNEVFCWYLFVVSGMLCEVMKGGILIVGYYIFESVSFFCF